MLVETHNRTYSMAISDNSNYDIRIGKAVVPYAELRSTPIYGPMKGQFLSPGWVFPGGERTSVQAKAIEMAHRISKFTD